MQANFLVGKKILSNAQVELFFENGQLKMKHMYDRNKKAFREFL
ncbi:hypothetical protein SAMN04488128_101214 [Chitinophaga eiseniae]|uniref:Uncharacterized protein n=1 Tax=Chitinophaga eiseniae TaxID=634771 RepID=A0A1T4KMM4_9BACT|nr:hypothetical protein SAMN04488128_101214 [Chitinophaga eiseniae]